MSSDRRNDPFTPVTPLSSHCGKLFKEEYSYNGESSAQPVQMGQSPSPDAVLGSHISTLDAAVTFLNDWHIDFGEVDTPTPDETRLAIGIRRNTDAALERLDRLRRSIVNRRHSLPASRKAQTP
jgi:hypothetical protein